MFRRLALSLLLLFTLLCRLIQPDPALAAQSRIKDVGFFRPRHSWSLSPSVRLTQLQGPEGWRPHMKDDDAPA